MKRGIYIIANDKVTDHAIALLNSIRLRDQDIPIAMIPYNSNYSNIAALLNQHYGVQIYDNLNFIEELSQKILTIFGENFFARPNVLRKLACWFGQFDEFLYIDTDVVVFEKITNNFQYFNEYDFICCDYQHLGGIKNVFTQKVLEDKIFSQAAMEDVFNSGFWGSKKNLFSENDLYETLGECAAHPEYLDFSEKTSDQPIINYILLKQIPRRFNIIRREGKAPGNWAGSTHFQSQDKILFDPLVNQPLQYLHWAGIRIQPGCPYWEIWQYYRNLNSALPTANIPAPVKPNQWQQTLSNIKQQLRQFKI
ncbi:LPS:glycosyltransferase [Nostoc sp. PCC 7524]|uniref:Npun_R2821/Npun_R2822 family protein n=1 Tax=Nostoc sp. (strain ATCC 29411 / PCC 7524) TaxID=28072 RepID=UPI00029ECC9D|nr:Npun_R2821/Npun_R2822 family protein [Nostoc sp. PCC 7524]AFY48082.1 LPS:glycosyltransferase [Nostoc sp. PCC 7524]